MKDTSLGHDELYENVCALNFKEVGHDEPWRDAVAKNLNELLGRAQWWMETDGDDSDDAFAKAVLSICHRVKEFDEIQTCTHAELIAMQHQARKEK